MLLTHVQASLKQLKLACMAQACEGLQARALTEQWTPLEYLGQLCQQELDHRLGQRVERFCRDAHFPAGKTLANLDLTQSLSPHRALILTLAQDNRWVTNAENLLLFGASGLGKTHLAAAIGHHLIVQGQTRVRFFNAASLVQYLQQAKLALTLPHYLAKLDKYSLLIIDDIGYVKKTEQETQVLFQLIAHRYESKSLLITSNQSFEAWENIFSDSVMTVAAIDRLVHHATIIELTGQSIRQQEALKRAALLSEVGGNKMNI